MVARFIFSFFFARKKTAATVLKLLERLLVSGGLGDLQRVELDGLRQRPEIRRGQCFNIFVTK
jgi:hypothetical protein